MGMITYAIACICFAAEPVDPGQLELMRQSLEAYLSRIQTLEMKYTETWEQSNNQDGQTEAIRHDEELERRTRWDAAGPEEKRVLERIARRANAKGFWTYNLLDAYPSLRLEIHLQRQFPDGTQEESRSLKTAHDGVYTEVNMDRKTINTKKGVDLHLFPRTPVNALGLRMRGTMGQPLTKLLEFPTLTTVEGVELINGIKTQVLKIGPGIPRNLLSGSPEGTWYRVWLAPSASHLPVRTEYHFGGGVAGQAEPSSAVHSAELSDLRPARDKARDESMLFPRILTYKDGAGTTRWNVEQVVINVPASAENFRSTEPMGFLVSREGAVPKVTLSGGREAQRRVIEATVKEADGQLNPEVPPSSRASAPFPLRIVIPIASLIVLVSLIVIQIRRR
jgi:hypothetical protein